MASEAVEAIKCQDCGTTYNVKFGHDNCPKKKKQSQEGFKQGRYLVTASAEISGVTIGVEFRVYEKDDVKGGQIEAFYLCHGTIEELVKKGIDEAKK